MNDVVIGLNSMKLSVEEISELYEYISSYGKTPIVGMYAASLHTFLEQALSDSNPAVRISNNCFLLDMECEMDLSRFDFIKFEQEIDYELIYNAMVDNKLINDPFRFFAK